MNDELKRILSRRNNSEIKHRFFYYEVLIFGYISKILVCPGYYKLSIVLAGRASSS